MNLSMFFRSLCFTFFLLISAASVAQFGNKVHTYNDSLNMLRGVYRTNVFNQLKNGRADAVVFNYGYETYLQSNYQASFQTSQIESVRHYLALSEIEAVYLIQHNFEGILEIVQNNGFVSYKKKRVELSDPRLTTGTGVFRSGDFSNEDSLSEAIGMFLLQEKEQIKNTIQESSYDTETKAFLHMFLDYELVYLWNAYKWDFETIEDEKKYHERYHSLNSKAIETAEKFLMNYPDSKFNDFINSFILYKSEVKKWALGFDVAFGTIIPMGEMSQNVWPSILYANLGFRIYRKNAFLNVMGGIGAALLRNDIFLDTVWTRGVSTFTGELTVGYCFDITDRFNITPLFGVRGAINEGPRFNGESSKFYVRNPLIYGLEFTIGGMTEPEQHLNPTYYNGSMRSGISLRFMYQSPGYGNVLPELDGGLFTVTMGMNIGFFGVKEPNKHLFK